MGPEIVNLDHVVQALFQARKIAWEVGIASLMADGMTREEAADHLPNIWLRASLAWERPWKLKPKKHLEHH
jgi:hypothetical protein